MSELHQAIHPIAAIRARREIEQTPEQRAGTIDAITRIGMRRMAERLQAEAKAEAAR